MSDYSISIIPRQSNYPDKVAKVKKILSWLISKDIVKPTLSDCVLGSDDGYSISEGARLITNLPEYLPFDIITNGLEIVTKRQIFHTGEGGMEECICPACKENIATEEWSFFDEWAEEKSDNLICPLCNVATEIHKFKFSPEWGFSDLGFTFWNWSDLTKEFIEDFRIKLGCDIDIVHTHL